MRITARVQSVGWYDANGHHRDAPQRNHIEDWQEGFVKRLAVLIATALVMISCTPDDEVTGSIHNKCASDLYPSYNSKALDQCMAVCIRCDHGTRATCSTSCTLKGAR